MGSQSNRMRNVEADYCQNQQRRKPISVIDFQCHRQWQVVRIDRRPVVWFAKMDMGMNERWWLFLLEEECQLWARGRGCVA